MERPSIPRGWRNALLAIALFSLAPFFGAYLGPRIGFALTYGMWALGSFGAGVALAGGMIGRGGRDRIAAGGGFVGAILFAWAGETPFHVLAGFGLGVALGLVFARHDLLPSGLAAGGFVLSLVGQRALMAYRGPIESVPSWPSALATIGALATAAGLVAYALRAPLVRTRPAGVGLAVASLTLGVVFLSLAWLAGGSLIGLVPIWPVGLAFLVAPAVARWRAWPAGTIVIGAIALAGAAPAGVCTEDPYSDVDTGAPPGADARPRLVSIYEIAGNGPGWFTGDGFSGFAVSCPASAVALGAGWILALATVSLAIVLRKAPPALTPEEQRHEDIGRG